MTERKPAGVSFETWVDAQIREARERGEFDNLPGTGKPLADIDGNEDEMWWVKKWLKREGVSFTPPAIALRKSVEDMLANLDRVRREEKLREVVEELNTRIRQQNRIPPIDGPPSSLMPLDVEGVVDKWRAIRAEIDASQPVDESPIETPAVPRRRRRFWRR